MSFFRRIFGKEESSQAPSRGHSKEDAFAAYIIREHKSGRSLEDILDDAYLKNRTTEEQRLRLLEAPEVIRAVGEDTAAMAAERVKTS